MRSIRFVFTILPFLFFNVAIAQPSDVIAYYPFTLFNGTLGDGAGNLEPTAITTGLGNENRAYQFDGVDDRIELPDGILDVEGVFTIGIYLRYNAFGGQAAKYRSILSKPGQFELLVKNSEIQFNTYDDTGSSLVSLSYDHSSDGNSIDDGVWHHVAVVHTANDVTIYVDGIEEATTTYSGTYQSSTSNPIVLSEPQDGNYLHFPGDIDELFFYARALSLTEVQDLSFVRDISGYLCPEDGVVFYGNAYPNGGIYSGPGVTDVGDGLYFSFDPIAAGLGDHVVTYTLSSPMRSMTHTISVGGETWAADADADGFPSDSEFTIACNQPDGYLETTEPVDCDDNDAAVNPESMWYADQDGDGFGDVNAVVVVQCEMPSGSASAYVLDNSDCDDNDSDITPLTNWYADEDGDGYADINAVAVVQCEIPTGPASAYVLDNTDCNDDDPLVYPGATDISNGVDDNCNGIIDDDNSFLSFSMPEQISSSIDLENHRVEVVVPGNYTGLDQTMTYTISEGASVNPTSYSNLTVGEQVVFEITSPDDRVEAWTLQLVEGLNDRDDIISITVLGRSGSSVIDDVAHTVSFDAFTLGSKIVTPTIELPYGATISPESDVAVDFTSPVVYTVTAENLETEDWIVTANFLPDVFYYYPFSGNYNDVSGNDFHGTSSDGPTLTTDRFGVSDRAYDFSTGTEVIEISSDILDGHEEATLAAWVRFPNISQGGSTNRLILGKGSNSNSQFGLFCTNNKFAFEVYNDGASNFFEINYSFTNEGLYDYSDDQWHFVVATFSASEANLYVDGELKGTDVTKYGVYTNTSTNPFVIGNWPSGNNDPFEGDIDDVSILDIALTAEEVISLMNRGQTAINSFTLPSQVSASIQANVSSNSDTVNVKMPYGTDLTNLIPTIVLSPGATISPVSGSSQNFSSAVTYTVTAEDGQTTQDWVVNVSLAPNTDASITNFSIAGQESSTILAGVSTDSDTVNVVMPYETDQTNLTPTITLPYGAAISPNSGVSQDFTGEVTYTVTAEDGSTRDWIINVENAPNSETDILSFSIEGSNATVNSGSQTITMNAPAGSFDIYNALASFTLSPGASAAIAGETQISGTTYNDFTEVLTFTVTAEDGVTTQDWTININIAPTLTDVSPSSAPIGTSLFIYGNNFNPTISNLDVTIGGVAATVTSASEQELRVDVPHFDDPVTAKNLAIVVSNKSLPSTDLLYFDVISTETDILSFFIPDSISTSIRSNDPMNSDTVDVVMPYGTDRTNLIPTIVLSAGATISPVSGSSQDFSSAVTYTITAEDGQTTQDWVVNVSLAPNTDASITDFSIAGQESSTILANIPTDSDTVNVVMPYDTQTNLTPTITLPYGATISPNSGFSQDFTGEVTYTVTAEDGSTRDWVIYVENALNSETDILSFSIEGSNATVNSGSHAITMNAPAGSFDINNALASFTLSPGASAAIAGETQISGTTYNDFTDALTLTVTAEDGVTTQDWSIDINIAPTLTAVSPPSAPIGTSLFINGNNFNSSISNLEVTIGGVAATVTSASNQQLRVDVPHFDDPATAKGLAIVVSNKSLQSTDLLYFDVISTETDILSFAIPGLVTSTFEASDPDNSDTVNVVVPCDVIIGEFTPTITISGGAEITPNSGVSRDFSSQMTYTVTAEDGSTVRDWVINVTNAPNTTWYADTDDDGYGDAGNMVVACEQPVGFVTNDLDCDDTGTGQNFPQSWYSDGDGDGLGDRDYGQWNSYGSGLNGQVYAIVESGDFIYVGGDFSFAGGVSARRIARWNKVTETWSALGDGVDGVVRSLLIQGDDLYVAGDFNAASGAGASKIAKWDITTETWSALGSGVNSSVYALALHESKLYVGGNFSSAGGSSSPYLAEWNIVSEEWDTHTGINNRIYALEIQNDLLYVGGDFTTIGGISASRIAAYDMVGDEWNALGVGVSSTVRAITSNASTLYVGGGFGQAGGSAAIHIAEWNIGNQSWSALGSGLNNSVFALTIAENELIVGGTFTSAGGISGANYVAKWDTYQDQWSSLAASLNSYVFALDNENGQLKIGGQFNAANGESNNRLVSYGGLLSCEAPTGFVDNKEDCDDTDNGIGSGTAWYADSDGDGFGDELVSVLSCTQPVNYVSNSEDCNDSDELITPATVWYLDSDGDGYGDNGTSTTQCEQPDGYVSDNTDCDDSSDLINPATTWYADVDEDGFGDTNVSLVQCDQPVGYVLDNTDCDDSDDTITPELVWYVDLDGDGQGDSSDLGIMSCEQPDGYVSNKTDCDDNNSNEFDGQTWYVDSDGDGYGDSGNMITQCEQPDGYVVNDSDCDDSDAEEFPGQAWFPDTDEDGFGDKTYREWTSYGSGLNGPVLVMTESGDDIYVGGSFTTAGEGSASRIAKWDKTSNSWSALGTGLNGTVRTILVEGDDIYVGGDFSQAGGSSALRIAKWNTLSETWSPLGSGTNATVYALALHESKLFVGGSFSTAGGSSSPFLAEWNVDTEDWTAVTGANSSIRDLMVVNDKLYAGGAFTLINGVSASRVAEYSLSNLTWIPMGSGVNATVLSLAVNGTDVFVGGLFTTAGGASANRAAKWDSNLGTWSSLSLIGDGENVFDLAIVNQQLYAAAEFTIASGSPPFVTYDQEYEVVEWDMETEQWSSLQNAPNSRVYAVASSSNLLYVGGPSFLNSYGGKVSCTMPAGFVTDHSDCDDSDDSINPGTTWYADSDGDGFGDSETTLSQCDQPEGYVLDNTDCNDTDETINPNTTWYADTDDDGFGDVNVTLTQCEQPAGYVLDNTDCDDNDDLINPATIWYEDVDEDGFGDVSSMLVQCDQPVGYVLNDNDCNDTDDTIHPNTVWYADTDGDGFGDLSITTMSCTQPADFVSDNTDCDDTKADVNPGEDLVLIVEPSLTFSGSFWATVEDCLAIQSGFTLEEPTSSTCADLTYTNDAPNTFYIDQQYTITWIAKDQGGTTVGTIQQTVEFENDAYPYFVSDPAQMNIEVDLVSGCTLPKAESDYENYVSIMYGCYNFPGDFDLENDAPTEFPIGETVVTWSIVSSTEAFDPITTTQTVTVNGANDVAGSGIDANCDGNYLWYLDQDGDGYGINETVSSTNATPGAGEADNKLDCYDNSALITTVCANVWNGTSWSDGSAPLGTELVLINGAYSLSADGSFEVDDLIIANGIELIVDGEATLTINGDIQNNGSIVVESGASLLTYDGSTWTGNQLHVKRNTRYAGGKYSFVGTPVQYNEDNIAADLGPIVYSYAGNISWGANEGLDRWIPETNAILIPGKGYAQANQQLVAFDGIPNTGAINIEGSYTGTPDDGVEDDYEGWVMVSNPYTAAINVEDFLTENDNIKGAVYIWDDNGSDTGRGSNSDYIVANAIEATNTTSAGGESRYNQYLGSAQGFFVKLLGNGDNIVDFTEDMRVSGSNSDNNYFRQTSMPKVRLNLTDDQGLFKQTLFGWIDGLDHTLMNRLYDAPLFDPSMDFGVYSVKQNHPLAIQGVSYLQERIEVGYNVAEAGNYRLEIDQTEYSGTLYLLDKKLKESTLLMSEGYEFYTEAGSFKERFELVTNSSEVLSPSDESLSMHCSDNVLYISLPSSNKEYFFTVVDLTGRSIFSYNTSQSTQVDLAGLVSGVYLVQEESSGASLKIVIK